MRTVPANAPKISSEGSNVFGEENKLISLVMYAIILLDFVLFVL
jgi:hypothetical protein